MPDDPSYQIFFFTSKFDPSVYFSFKLSTPRTCEFDEAYVHHAIKIDMSWDQYFSTFDPTNVPFLGPDKGILESRLNWVWEIIAISIDLH